MKRNKKQIIGLIAMLLVAAVAVGGIALWLHQNKLEQLQNEALAELERDVGQYDEQSIVLYETSKAKAEELAELYHAELRITENGRFATLTLPEGTTIRDVYAMDESLQHIDEMAADYQVSVSELTEEEEGSGERLPQRPQYTVSDEDYELQTYLDYLNMGEVWNRYTGSGVTVAVIDTGIDTDHPEFSGRISEYSYNATEDKIVKDWLLEDGSYDWSLIEDEQGHGTAVAGVIAAPKDVGNVVGVAPNVELLVIKAECDEQGRFLRTSDLVFGLYYAIEQDADVVNMSFGGTGNHYGDALQLAYDSDVICVAAAGNSSTAVLTYPAADARVIGVGALGGGWNLARYSNYGDNTDVVAPGTTYTTLMDGGYGNMTGTSLASPVVAGAVALLLQSDPHMTFDAVQELLHASSYDLGEPGRDWYYGFGALDISALILEERGTITYDMLTDEVENMEGLFIQGHTLQELPEPERLYAVFDGWYYDDTFTQEYNYYEDKFYGEVTLYAKWANEDDALPFDYTILPDGTVEIAAYTGSGKYVTVPELIEGRVVSSIGKNAFSEQKNLREVTLPSGLSKIGEFAFYNCANLIQIEIPENVTRIESNAFNGCIRLYSVAFLGTSKLTSIGDHTFAYCGNLERIDLPASLREIGSAVFSGATALHYIGVQQGNTAFQTKEGILFNISGRVLLSFPAAWGSSYTIPAETTTIDAYAFANAKLRTIDFANVTSVGDYAFYHAELISLTIPDTLTSLGTNAFSNCEFLHELQLGRGIRQIPSYAFERTGLETVTILNTVTVIDTGAFKESLLQSVVFEEDSTLAVIGSDAFRECRIREIDIPASCLEIGSGAFADNLEQMRIGFEEESLLHTIGDNAFSNNVHLHQVVLPQSLQTIGYMAFSGTGLIQVQIPSNVSQLGAGAFAYCAGLLSVEVAENNTYYHDIDGVVYTRDNAALCAYPAGNSMRIYTVESAARTILPYSFAGTQRLEHVTLPEGMTVLGNHALFNAGIRTVTLPETLVEIGAHAFSSCTYLNSIQIPDNVQYIGADAFSQDWDLQTVSFNETSQLPKLEDRAFANCGITTFRVPASVSSVGRNVFEGCSYLRSVTFAAGSKLEAIRAYTFNYCANLQSIVFEPGSALTSIQAHGFEGMEELRSVDFGDAKLENIDNFAFRFCKSLAQLELPDTVTNIGRYAFYGCESLSELQIPCSVEHIGSYAFLSAGKTQLYFQAEALPMYLDENWDHGAGGYYLGVTSVKENDEFRYAVMTSGSIGILKYLGSDTDLDMTKLQLGGDITVIGAAFTDSALKTVTLPDTLTTIQAEAFAYSALERIVIPANVTFIGRRAFSNTNLTSVTFADNAKLAVVEQYAFANTKNLTELTLPASVTKLGTGVFQSSGLENILFAPGIKLEEIPQLAFAETKLTGITLPDSVTLVNHNAFNNVQTLQSVTFGSNEGMRVMDNAFYRTGLTAVHIPANVTYIGDYAFTALRNLQTFTVDADNPAYAAVDGLLLDKSCKKLITVPAGRTGSLTVPVAVEEIGAGAFEESKLSEVIFHKDGNLLTIGYRAFYGANSITTITVPASVVRMGYYAFAYCENLQEVIFADGNKLADIREGTFCGDINLSSIVLPQSVVEICDFAFFSCSKITAIPVAQDAQLLGIYDYAFAYTGMEGEFIAPESLVDIGNYAFMGNRFTKVTIPDTNKKTLMIGIGAFEDCNQLTEITLPFIGASYENEEISWFGYIFGAGSYEANETYVPAGLKTVTLTDGLTTIYTGGFYGCWGLEHIDLPHSVSVVWDYAFGSTIARFELTNVITGYSYDSFEDRTYLKLTWNMLGDGLTGKLTVSGDVQSVYIHGGKVSEIVLLEGVRTIEKIFCSAMHTLTIPSTVTEIWENALQLCTELQQINLPESGTAAYFADGVLYDYPVSRIVWVAQELPETVQIPDGVTHIGMDTFASRKGMKNLIIPDSVIQIGYRAFYDCQDLTNVVCSANATDIGQEAFQGCWELETFTNTSNLVTIGSNAFSGCRKLQGFDLPDTLVNLGEWAFNGCQSLSSIVIPSGVTHIPDRAFASCYGLSHVTLPDTLIEVGASAFGHCGITNLTIPASVQYIEWDSFECPNLIKITNNSSLPIAMGDTTYGNYVSQIKCLVDAQGNQTLAENTILTEDGFYFDTSSGEYVLRGYVGQENTVTLPQDINGNAYRVSEFCGAAHVVIPDTMTNLNFGGSDSLCSITIPDTVTTIEELNLARCANLRSVVIPDSVTTIGYISFGWCENLQSVTLPAAMTEIPSYLFNNCRALESITIPDGVTKICSGAFNDCVMLTDISLPNGVQTVESGAFSGCVGLESIAIPDSLSNFVPDAFPSGAKLIFSETNPYYAMVDGILYNAQRTAIVYVSPNVSGYIALPETLTKIGDYAFRDCVGITGITIPDSVTSIGSGAFFGCTGLESITIPSSVTTIADATFQNCTNLRVAILPNSLTGIGGAAFSNCYLLDSVLAVGEAPQETDEPLWPWLDHMNGMSSAFGGCRSLRKVQIPAGITSIKDDAFRDCVALTTVTIPDSVTSIGKSAFALCEGLLTLDIPNSVTCIEDEAFRGCTNLQSITLPDSVTEIGSGVFLDCTSLKDILVSEGNTSFCFVDGILYDNPATHIIWVSNLLPSHVVIPEGITEISKATFKNCETLEQITLPGTLKSIGWQAFYGCTELKQITIPEGITEISEAAFENCETLAQVALPGALKSIGNRAFYGCAELKQIAIPEGLTRIGEYAFSCSGLEEICIPDSVTELEYRVFLDCTELVSVRLPALLQKLPSATFGGCSKLETVVIPDGVSHIDSSAFSGCTALKEVTMPAALFSIDVASFKDCTSLKHLALPEGLVEIMYGAFQGCVNLGSVEIPESLVQIEDNAFFGCSALLTVINHGDLPLTLGSRDYGWLMNYALRLIDKDGNIHYPNDTYFETDDHFLYTYDGTFYTLHGYLGDADTVTLPTQINGSSYSTYHFRGAEHVIVPDTVTELSESMFDGCIQLKSIVLPEGLTQIGALAFAGCQNLQSVTLPESLTCIGSAAFMECRSFESITLPDGLEVIESYAFESCWNLYSIRIPETVEYIGANAFAVSQRASALFDNPAYYQNGLLIVDGWLLYVDDTVDYVPHMDALRGVVPGDDYSFASAYMEVQYTLKNAPWCSGAQFLTNLEVAYLCGITPITPPLQPSVTLKSVVIGPNVAAGDLWNQPSLFANMTDITIFADALEEDLRWDANFPGWSNGNRVVYADQWHWVNFYDETGRLIYSEPCLNAQTSRLPVFDRAPDERYTYQTVGWDVDGDGVADGIPASSVTDIYAKPVCIAVERKYTVSFMDADTGTVYQQLELPYGAQITVHVENPVKQGHDFLGWMLTEGATVTGDTVIYAIWNHHGTGHCYDQTIWLDATCDQPGHYLHTCTVCGHSYTTGQTEPLGHQYAVQVVEPTCDAQGYTLYQCTTCGHSYQDDFRKNLPHSYGQWIVDVAPQCAVDGIRHHICDLCGHCEEDIAAATGHTFRVTNQVDATCTVNGMQTLYCDDCGLTVEEVLPMAQHSYRKQLTTREFLAQMQIWTPNILWGNEGDMVYYYQCADCGKLLHTDDQTDTGGSTGIASIACRHENATWKLTIQGDCSKPNMQTLICDICGKVITAKTQQNEMQHAYVQYDGKAPTCVEPGWAPYEICQNCGHSTYTELPATGNHSYTAEVTREPCCESDGEMAYTCTACGSSYTEVIPANGHSYSGVVIDPTCVEDGYTAYTCAVCGHSYRDDYVFAFGHDYKTVVTDPTCTEGGCTTHTCVTCGDQYEDTHTDALGHDFVDGVCSRCGQLDVILGDVNGDGKINARDARLLLRYAAGLVGDDEIELAAADYNGDGKINARDARAVLRFAAGLD